MADEDGTGYFVPLQNQSVFGAGICRKKINFVSPSNPDQRLATGPPNPGAGDRYLSIVLNKISHTGDGKAKSTEEVLTADTISDQDRPNRATCEVCRLPIDANDVDVQQTKPHETSLAHQACLPHSHPPSHLDRNRQGLKYLSTYGWNPDSRLGLGATGTGIRIPIKAKPKNDTLGIGSIAMSSSSSKVNKKPLKKLDAKQTRKAEERARRDRVRIQDMFYQHEDVEKYLGGEG